MIPVMDDIVNVLPEDIVLCIINILSYVIGYVLHTTLGIHDEQKAIQGLDKNMRKTLYICSMKIRTTFPQRFEIIVRPTTHPITSLVFFFFPSFVSRFFFFCFFFLLLFIYRAHFIIHFVSRFTVCLRIILYHCYSIRKEFRSSTDLKLNES